MNIIPTPKNIQKREGFLENKTIRLVSELNDKRLINALAFLPQSDEGTLLEVNIDKKGQEAYSLNIESDKIKINAGNDAGVFYAIQTLRQLFNCDEVSCCYIEDEPDYEYRGFYHDVTRGKVPKVETIKKLIDDMAYYKLNSLQLYVEHTFEFKELADIHEKTGCLTAEEIREIDEYCYENFIEFIPSIATFGHLYELLQKDEYSHLREIESIEEKRLFWEDRMLHHTIDPKNKESFELIKSLLDQYMVNFRSDKFNICCDETFDLKIGKHKNEDTGKLYIEFVNKIIKYLKSKNKKVMMWADILLNHPTQIENLPDDVELLNWFYWENPDENSFKTINEAGMTQIVCPGTGTWNRLCEDYKTEIINISKMTEMGYQYGAKGVLNTNWGDWGNPCSIELAMFGLVFGAEKSWNVSGKISEEYISRVNKLLYQNKNACKYIEKLSDISNTINWTTLAKCYGNILNEKVYDVEFPDEMELAKAVVECLELIETVRKDDWENDRYKKQIILSAEGLIVVAELLAVQAGYEVNRKSDTVKWLENYRRLWLEDNKESELCEIERMFFDIENYVKKDEAK